MMQPRAYSYLRFSTDEQKHGDSQRRQMQAAEDYAAKHGLCLDADYRLSDEGVSAFRGKNAKKGALRRFLDAVEDGDVEEGSYLLVENIDRLSREAAWEALGTFTAIINAGIIIVTLQDEKCWSKAELKDNPFRIFESLMVMIRANEESAVKERRLRAVWSHKRTKAAEEGLRLTSICPRWLEPNDAGSFDKIGPRVKIVRRIFTLAQGGMGQHAIAAELNRAGMPTFGGGKHWHRSYIKKVLENPAVFGRLVPHEIVDGKRQPREPVDRYYPPIISRDLFDEVQNMGKGAKSRSGRNTVVRNVLAGLAKCPRCDTGLTRWTDGKRQYFVCTGKRAGTGCDQPNIRYELVQRALFYENFETVPPPSANEKAAKAWREAMAMDQIISEKSWEAHNLVDEIKRGSTSAAVRDDLDKLEREIASDRVELDRLRKQAGGLKADQWQKWIDRLVEACAAGDAQKTNEALRQLVDKVEVDTEHVTLFLKHGETASLPIVENLLTDIEGYVG